MSDSDSDNENFLLQDEGPAKAVTMTAAKKAMLKDIADEFGNKDLADLPFLHGVEPLTGGRLNLRRVFTDQFKLLLSEREEEEKQKRIQLSLSAAAAATTTTNTSSSLPARRKREVEEEKHRSQQQNDKSADHNILPLTFLELCQATAYGPQIILSEKRMNLIRWKNTPTDNNIINNKTIYFQNPSKTTTRVCTCCGRLARFRCPVCFSKINLNNSHNNNQVIYSSSSDDHQKSSSGNVSFVVSSNAGGSSAIFSDPDGGLVCSQACLELHAATRCGKHVQ